MSYLCQILALSVNTAFVGNNRITNCTDVGIKDERQRPCAGG